MLRLIRKFVLAKITIHNGHKKTPHQLPVKLSNQKSFMRCSRNYFSGSLICAGKYNRSQTGFYQSTFLCKTKDMVALDPE